MKKAILQKTAVSIITVAMLASPVSALADTGNFPDMPNDWSTAALNHAVKSGLLYGIDGKIEPNMKLTKAQLAAIMVRAFGSSGTADISKYTDVVSDAWYSDSVAKAIYMGILSGSDGKINPDKNVTRQEAAVVLALAFGLEPAPEYVEGFSDSADVADWAKGAVGALVKAGYMKGADGKLLPNKELTRAEFAQIMYTAVQLYITQPGTYTSVPEGNVLISSSDVTLSGVNVTGNLIIGNGVGDGTVYIKDSNINNINKRLDESNISYLDEENTDNNNAEPAKNNNSGSSSSSGGGSHSRPSTQKTPPSLKEEPGKQSDGKSFGLYPAPGDYYIAMFSTADHDDDYKNEVAYVDNIASVIVGGVKYTRTNDINKIINGEEKLFYVDSENCGVIISGGEDFDGSPDEKVKVIITSKGYKNVDFELSKEDKNIIHTPPAYTKIAKLTGTSLETQDYIYKVDFDNASDYLGKITDIWVNGIRIPPLTYIENFEPLADTMQYYFVDAENSCLYISSGELSGYKLIGADVQIVADGYEDYKFVFNVESNLKAAPELAEVPGKLSEGKGFGFYNKPTGSDFDYYIAMFCGPTPATPDAFLYAIEYTKHITKVEVNGVEYSKVYTLNSLDYGKHTFYVDDVINGGLLISDGGEFVGDPSEKVTVTVYADGYENTQFTVNKEKLKETSNLPKYKSIEQDSTYSYLYTLKFDSDADSYLENIKNIYVDGSDIPLVDDKSVLEDYGDILQYCMVDVENHCIYFSDASTLGLEVVGKQVKIKAKNFDDYIFTFEITNSVKSAPALAETPGKLSEGKGFGFYNRPFGSNLDYYIAMFYGSAPDKSVDYKAALEYCKNIYKIEVDGVEYSRKSSLSFIDYGKHTFYVDDNLNCGVLISDGGAFVGNPSEKANVVIYSTGYENVEFKVNKEKAKEVLTIPKIVSIEKDSTNPHIYVIKYDSDAGSYLKNIKSIYSDGLPVMEYDDMSALESMGDILQYYYVDTDNNCIYISDGSDSSYELVGKELEISAKDYDDYKFIFNTIEPEKQVPPYTKIAKATDTGLEVEDYVYRIDFDNAADYLNDITNIWVDGINIPPLTYIENFEPLADTMQYYFIDAKNSCIYISSGELSGYSLIDADIEIVTKNYPKYNFTFKLSDSDTELKTPALAETPGKLSEGKGFGFYNRPSDSDFDFYVAMFYGDKPDNSDEYKAALKYCQNIYKVEVDGVEYSKAQSLSFLDYGKHTFYVDDELNCGVLISDGGAFVGNPNETVNVVIYSTGYDNVEFKVNKEKSKAKPDAPAFTDIVQDSTYSHIYALKFDDSAAGFLKNIKTIYVDGLEIIESTDKYTLEWLGDSIQYYYIDKDENCIYFSDASLVGLSIVGMDVKIQANNYNDYIFKFQKDSSESKLKDAPALSEDPGKLSEGKGMGIYKKPSNSDIDYYISLFYDTEPDYSEEYDKVVEYLNSITKVCVNDVKYKECSGMSKIANGEHTYYVDTTSGCAVIISDGGEFADSKDEKVKVTIYADGYKEVAFTVNREAKQEETGGIKFTDIIQDSTYEFIYTLQFDSSADAFLKNIKEVYVDGDNISGLDDKSYLEFSGDVIQYYVVDVANHCIYFSDGSYAGLELVGKTVKIQSKDFDDYVFTFEKSN